MTRPDVSVVIACFNYAHWLPDSVGSVLEQTFADFELLIVDDGSTDDSLEVARRLAQSDARITAIGQAGAGQPAIPRNRAIERARGRYIVSLDADDRLGPTALELCRAELEADPRAGLAFPQQQDFGASDQLHPHLDWRLERLKRFNYLPSATMFRRSAWEAAGGYNTNVRGYEDWDLWLGIAEAGFIGRAAPGALWYYRRHDGGVYLQSKGSDQRLKAQVIVNRSGVFGDGVLTWARGVLACEPNALAVDARVGIVPELPDPPGPLRVARDPAERADWYVDVDGLEGPRESRTLEESLAMIDALGYTRVHAGGVEVAHRRASDPVRCPIPFFVGPTDPGERARVLASVLEDVMIAHALRAGAALDAARTAAFLNVPAAELPALVSEAQALMQDPGPVPVARALALARVAGVLRSELTLAGDGERARRASELERAAARAGLEEARSLAILAFADELIASPALLEAYGSVVSGEHDATLVIVTHDPASLAKAVACAGLDGERSADLLAVEAAPPGVAAVLSHHEHGGLQRFDETSLDALRALVAA
ncbi:MAG TPA: glycosyltransferase family A protein [Solirubrobacteraceae bacterium]|nr:glycosyltransferase family A protein [Solirubrobacteraceae bacterium]